MKGAPIVLERMPDSLWCLNRTFLIRHLSPRELPETRMKALAFCLFLVGMAFCAGCATHRNGLESREQVSYYDRNGDGRVDQEVHRYRGVADADWELRDDNYDGRYEKKIIYGVGIVESPVDLPVPTHVHIEPKP